MNDYNYSFLECSPLLCTIFMYVYISIHMYVYKPICIFTYIYGSSTGKESTCNPGDSVLFLGWEDPLQKDMATHSSILARRIAMDRGATVHGNKDSGLTEWLSTAYYFTYYVFYKISINNILIMNEYWKMTIHFLDSIIKNYAAGWSSGCLRSSHQDLYDLIRLNINEHPCSC